MLLGDSSTVFISTNIKKSMINSKELKIMNRECRNEVISLGTFPIVAKVKLEITKCDSKIQNVDGMPF